MNQFEINIPCPICGREEEGHWVFPCSSDDCPSRQNKVELAKCYAHIAHDSIGQKRKYTGEPYHVHTDEVASIVASTFSNEGQAASLLNGRGGKIYSPSEQDYMLCAAHCHDIVEDVMTASTTPHLYDLYAISDLFGNTVAALVNALTDEYTKEAWPELNRARRKQLERERIEQTSPEAKTIKLADLISNTKSIVRYDKDFAQVYLREKFALLGCLAEGNPVLLQRATEQCLNAMREIGIKIPMIVAK